MDATQLRPVRTILVGTGLTLESVGGVLLAKELAGRMGAALHVVHVVETAGGGGGGEDGAALERMAREELGLFAASHGLDTAGAGLHVARGAAEGELLRVMGEVGADLLVLGRYGRGGPRVGGGGGALGSVADRMVRVSPVSVLIADPLRRGGMGKIGVATDFSEESELGIRRGVELARLMGQGEVALLHAYEPPRGFHRVMTEGEACEKLEEVARARAASLEEKLGGGVALRLCAGEGPAGVVVPALAREEGLGLLVMNTHTRSRAAQYMLKRTTERVLHGIGCSVWAEKWPEGYQGVGAVIGGIVGV